jgi:hypothetical protein
MGASQEHLVWVNGFADGTGQLKQAVYEHGLPLAAQLGLEDYASNRNPALPGRLGTAPFPSCPRAMGRLQGRTLALARLGMTRTRVRGRYWHSKLRSHRWWEFFCLSQGGVGVGYGSPTLLRAVPRAKRARLRGVAVWIAATNHRYSLHGVRVGTGAGAAARRLHARAPLRAGRDRWYLRKGRLLTGFLQVRRGRVRAIAIAAGALTRTRADTRLVRALGAMG